MKINVLTSLWRQRDKVICSRTWKWNWAVLCVKWKLQLFFSLRVLCVAWSQGQFFIPIQSMLAPPSKKLNTARLRHNTSHRLCWDVVKEEKCWIIIVLIYISGRCSNVPFLFLKCFVFLTWPVLLTSISDRKNRINSGNRKTPGGQSPKTEARITYSTTGAF